MGTKKYLPPNDYFFEMEKKKLILNKQTLLRLQERQLKTQLGAEQAMFTYSPAPEHSGFCQSFEEYCQPEATCCQKSC